MLFNSLDFVFFLPLVLAIYFISPQRYRWIVLLIASYYFYASWKVQYLFTLGATTLIVYVTALMMGKTEKDSERKKYMWISVVSNLSILFLFKYVNFFSDMVRSAFHMLSLSYPVDLPRFGLPVGISFYTFQALSYTIDVYRRKRPPEKHLGMVALYVSFFPQLLAGPIERSTTLLPQFFQKQSFDWNEFKNGFFLMLWGYYEKVIVADRLSIYVNQVFGQPYRFHGLHVLIAALLFPMQLYCDFSGYSHIAIGIAQMMGFKLMKNFDRPFVSQSVREFISRWHISLTRWIMDYVYFPLAKKWETAKYRYLLGMLVMLLIWLWHGLSWNFLIVGISGGIFLVQSDRGMNAKRNHLSGPAHSHWRLRIGAFYRAGSLYFWLAVFWGVIFRSGSIDTASLLWANFFRNIQFSLGAILLPGFTLYELLIAVLAIVVLQIVEWRDHRSPIFATFAEKPLWVQYAMANALIYSILMFGEFNRYPFIYFQF